MNTRLFSNPNVALVTEMELFPDTTFTVDWDNAEKMTQPAGMLWTGRVHGVPESRAALVISGNSVTANITKGDGVVYELRTTADGRQWVREVIQQVFPREAEPLNPNKKPI